MSELHIHERIQNALNILNGMTLTGFNQFNAVATVMKELATLDQAIQQNEQAQKAEEKADEQACETD